MASVMLGFAYKQGQNRRSWRRRYFVISPLSGSLWMLSYFVSEAEAFTGAPTARKGCVVLGKDSEILEETQCKVVWPSGSHVSRTGLGIRTKHRTLYLHCKTPADAVEWKNLLRNKIEESSSTGSETFSQAYLQQQFSSQSSDYPSEFSDEGEDDGGRASRLSTVVVRNYNHAQLVTLSKQLANRNVSLNDELFESEQHVARLEREITALHSFSSYLRGVLFAHRISLDSLEPFSAFITDPHRKRRYCGVDITKSLGVNDDYGNSQYDEDDDSDSGEWGFDLKTQQSDSLVEVQNKKVDEGKDKASGKPVILDNSSYSTSSRIAQKSRTSIKRSSSKDSRKKRDLDILKRQQERAAIIIQRWYRTVRVTRVYQKVRVGASDRGRRRTLDRQRLNAKVHPQHAYIHSRPRLPTTSLGTSGIVSSVASYPGTLRSSSISVAAAQLQHQQLQALSSRSHFSQGDYANGLCGPFPPKQQQANGTSLIERDAGLPLHSSRRLTTSIRPLPRQDEIEEESEPVSLQELHLSSKAANKQENAVSIENVDRADGGSSQKRYSKKIEFSPLLQDTSTMLDNKNKEVNARVVSGIFDGKSVSLTACTQTESIGQDAEYFSIEPTATNEQDIHKSTMSDQAMPVDSAIDISQVALYRFNQSPNKGLVDLIQAGLVIDDPFSIISFLSEEPGVSRAMLGDFFGSSDPRSSACLAAYAQTFDFTNAAIDVCLRLFLLAFRIPGEAQKIERVLTAFANRYHRCNPSCFCHEDTALVLAFSIMMLHTDLHNPSNRRKMTKEEFVRNNRGIDDGADIPRRILEDVYTRIQQQEFQCCVDNTAKVEDITKRMSGNIPPTMITETRRYKRMVDVNELYRSKKDKDKRIAVKRVVTLVVFNDLVLVAAHSRTGRKLQIRKSFDIFQSKLDKTQMSGTTVVVLSQSKDSDTFRFVTSDIQTVNLLEECFRLCTLVKSGNSSDSNC